MRNYSLIQIFIFHSSGTQVSDKLPWNSTQRNSLHSKITVHSERYTSLLHLLKIFHGIEGEEKEVRENPNKGNKEVRADITGP